MKIAFTKKGLDKIVDRELRKMGMDERLNRARRTAESRIPGVNLVSLVSVGSYSENYEPRIPIVSHYEIPSFLIATGRDVIKKPKYCRNNPPEIHDSEGTYNLFSQLQLIVLDNDVCVQELSQYFYDYTERKQSLLESIGYSRRPLSKEYKRRVKEIMVEEATRRFLNSDLDKRSTMGNWYCNIDSSRLIVVGNEDNLKEVYSALRKVTSETDFKAN